MTTDENTSVFEKLEFWALTALFVMCLPAYIGGDPAITLRYVLFFLVLLYVDFRIVPQLARRERVRKNVVMSIASLALIVVVHLIPSISIFREQVGSNSTLFRGVIINSGIFVLLIVVYLVVKRVVLFMISKHEILRSFFIIPNRDGLMAFGLWMIVMYWLLFLDAPTEVRLAWLAAVPSGILLHAIAFHYFIPESLKSKHPLVSYFFRAGIYCVVVGFAVSLLMVIITDDENQGFVYGLFTGVVNMIFTAPALFLIYRWQTRQSKQISDLQGKLGRSTANLDLLRSQINPHFLFNALNTIYGLAIQEKADRTGAAVEKLGDMMRFMLLENMQEKISLKRELEYLDDYISLQKLRTDGNSQLSILVDIPQEIDPTIKITPMLLIPFVENAFKHGISLREPSYIRISLEIDKLNLYFDVSNSTHQKPENDPEGNNNGIGLVNVRQRLQHMYAGRYELLVRETGRDFFVHLRIELE